MTDTVPEQNLTIHTDHFVSSGEISRTLKDSFNNVAFVEASGEDLKRGGLLDPQKTLAYFLPGISGDHSPYNDQIGPTGNAEIRRYVENGGVFVGTCAGAYYACEHIVYDAPWIYPAKTNRPGLNFFNALAHGPVRSNAMQAQDDQWFGDCSVISVRYKDKDGAEKRGGIAYGNGPALIPRDPNDPDLEIIARYDDTPNNDIALAVQRVGKGLAIFMGVIPYIRYDEQYADSPFPKLAALTADLQKHEESRSEVWSLLMDRIQQHHFDLGTLNKAVLRHQP